MMKFNEKLRSMRTAEGLTEETLADAIGVSAEKITGWENGESVPDEAERALIESYFNKENAESFKAREADDKNGQKIKKTTYFTYYLGFALCLAGFICLIIWGIITLTEPTYTYVYTGAARFSFDNRVILLIACVDLVLTGLVLLFRKQK